MRKLNTDSDKIDVIPEMMGEIARLNKILIVGEPESDEPGLLENVRNIRKNVQEIKESQPFYFTLEKRVADIEARHRILDLENESNQERKKKRVDAMSIAVFGMIVSNIGTMIMLWLGFGK